MTPHKNEDVEVEIERLRDLDLAGLQARWRSVFGRSAPGHLPKSLLYRLLAYRLQAQVHGDLSPATAKFLDGLGRVKNSGTKSVTLPQQGKLRLGTVLIREHGGKRHAVTVVENGFAWNGSVYPSLSKAAKAITGVNWNGPRFFGLREEMKP